MIINVDALRAMLAAGATAEMIVAFVEARLKHKREMDAARQRRKRRNVTLSHAESRNVTQCHADIAGGTHNVEAPTAVAPQSAVVTLAEVVAEETNKKKSLPHPLKKNTTYQDSLFENLEESEAVDARARERKPRATRLPDDWEPTLDDLKFAKALFPDPKVAIEAAKFRDYWHARAGPGAVKRSWPATWRNWCRKEAERVEDGGKNGGFRTGGTAGHRGESFALAALRYAREASEKRR